MSDNDQNMKELKGRLLEVMGRYGETQQVVITPSPMARHETIAKVLSTCTAAGVKNLCFGG